MKGKACIFRNLFTVESIKVDLCYYYRIISPCTKAELFSTSTNISSRSSLHLSETVKEADKVAGFPNCAAEVLKSYGCSDSQICTIFSRQPALRNSIPSHLESKLDLLRKMGVSSSELVWMVHCRPWFLRCRLNICFEERLDHLQSLFESKDLFLKAITRNPSLLVYDVHKTIVPIFSLYQQMGICRRDVISMLIHRPTMIPRTNISPEKLEYIHKTGICSQSKMYKYVVTIMAVSRTETIREKIANFEKYGFSENEVLELFGRNPLMMTLSVEKVQRNMTFVLGDMKLPAKTVVNYPFLLFSSLEVLLRPRVLLAGKMREMDLHKQIDGADIFRALRMSEKRFLKVFVDCQEKEVKNELLLYYRASKGIKRLAVSSKKVSYTKGFPY